MVEVTWKGKLKQVSRVGGVASKLGVVIWDSVGKGGGCTHADETESTDQRPLTALTRIF